MNKLMIRGLSNPQINPLVWPFNHHTTTIKLLLILMVLDALCMNGSNVIQMHVKAPREEAKHQLIRATALWPGGAYGGGHPLGVAARHGVLAAGTAGLPSGEPPDFKFECKAW